MTAKDRFQTVDDFTSTESVLQSMKHCLKVFTTSDFFHCKVYYGFKFPAKNLTISKHFERKLLMAGSKCHGKHRKHLRIYDVMGGPAPE